MDQLAVFLAVVEAGGFGAAARRLGRAVSVVSYQIEGLERRLGLTLFARGGARRPALTPAGAALAAEARQIVQGLDALLGRAQGLKDGLEAEVTLAVDLLLPPERLAEAARAFQDAFPTVRLRLMVEGFGAVTRLVAEREATLGVCGAQGEILPGLVRAPAGHVDLIPAAAPDHPLAGRIPLRAGEAQDHLQIVVSDRSRLSEGRDFGVLAHETWRVADLSTKRALLLAGVGWGSLPEPMIAEDLVAGRLVRLDPPELGPVAYPFMVVRRADIPPGPAGQWLAGRFAGTVG